MRIVKKTQCLATVISLTADISDMKQMNEAQTFANICKLGKWLCSQLYI